MANVAPSQSNTGPTGPMDVYDSFSGMKNDNSLDYYGAQNMNMSFGYNLTQGYGSMQGYGKMDYNQDIDNNGRFCLTPHSLNLF
jgi:hypothetical protein